MTVLDLHFAAPICRNCGAGLSTAFCAACGQPKARRFDLGAVRSEAWQGWRVFEWETLRAAARLARWPGLVARDYVLGARRKHVHPLKLLLLGIGALLLVQAHSAYFAAGDERVNRALALALDYGRWSFSLGIVAIFGASMTVLRRRGGFNATEHLVLAVYAHFLIVLAGALNLLPTLGASVPAWHKAGSPWWMGAIEAAIVALAFRQFFALDARRDAARLALAVVLFLCFKWLLVRAYSLALVRLVLFQVSHGASA